jgi:NADH-quinone oxidoreductase subunit G
MVEVEIDGVKVQVAEGSMLMHACEKLGTYVPHFCYHPKLSIAANCRMCLVDVEKAPKPLPACATPVSQGMIVRTKSERALSAQKGVMEFLLINHPLDCPICDQGGECQLQDLAVGYGGSSSRFEEEKRVVPHKDAGPLVSMEEMSRCIHCTRCVRFGQEVAGVMELGMPNRGEHSEIAPFIGMSIDSELSGNMIDICPVGALTSKPFRYSARTWELGRRKSISPHDSTGANLVVQVKADKVMRIVPLENEAVNECWISDRDRFSYEALNGQERLTHPMVKIDGAWAEVSWDEAIKAVAQGLRAVQSKHGASSIGTLAAPHSTVEELHLLQAITRGLGSENIDHRLRGLDPELRAADGKALWLGRSIRSLSSLGAALIVGSNLRKDHPLFSARLRKAARAGSSIHLIRSEADDQLMPLRSDTLLRPSEYRRALAEILVALAVAKDVAVPSEYQALKPSAAARVSALALAQAPESAILLGSMVANHREAAELLAIANRIASLSESKVGFFGEAGNTVGAQRVGCLPGAGGLSADQMVQAPRNAYVLFNTEPELDMANGAQALRAVTQAEFVVSMSPFKHQGHAYANVMLPIAPFTETSGHFVNAEGLGQRFNPAVKPLRETRPGWKVLRALGASLGLDGFDFQSSDEVAASIGNLLATDYLSNECSHPPSGDLGTQSSIEVFSSSAIYSGDSIVRRAPSLQATADGRRAEVEFAEDVWMAMSMQPGKAVRLSNGTAGFDVKPSLNRKLAKGTVRVAAGSASAAKLGADCQVTPA